MKALHRKALIGTLRTFVMLAAATFVPVWTLRWWRGWVCLGAFFVPACLITVWMAKHDPALLERRMKAGPTAEKEKAFKIAHTIAALVFLADFGIPAFDHRFGWSHVPAWVATIGYLMMATGLFICFRVARVNSYASSIIEVADDQKVISTGPYSVVRHPLYSGALVMLFGIPLALGSWWGMLVNVPMAGAIVWRLLDEERFLVGKLPGYADYLGTVRYRLAPFVW